MIFANTGFIDHLTLEVDEDRFYLSTRMPPSIVRFTVVRDPVNQFLSYYGHMAVIPRSFMLVVLVATVRLNP